MEIWSGADATNSICLCTALDTLHFSLLMPPYTSSSKYQTFMCYSTLLDTQPVEGGAAGVFCQCADTDHEPNTSKLTGFCQLSIV